MRKHLLFLLSALLLLSIAACADAESGAEAAGEAVEDAAIVASNDAPDTADEASGPIDFSETDLDLYQLGIAKEIEIVRAASERGRDAATPAERGAAMQAQWEDQSIPAAAEAAGIPEDRYRLTRQAVHEVFKTLDFQGKIDGPLSMDMSRASEEIKAKLARDPFETLTPAAAAALRARMDALVPVWIEYVRMTAVAG